MGYPVEAQLEKVASFDVQFSRCLLEPAGGFDWDSIAGRWIFSLSVGRLKDSVWSLTSLKLGLAGESEGLRYSTGKISIVGTGGGELKVKRFSRWSLDIDVRAEVVYRAVQLKLFRQQRRYKDEPGEIFMGHLQATLVEMSPFAGFNELLFEDGYIHLNKEEATLGYIENIRIPLAGARVQLQTLSEKYKNGSCPEGVVKKRVIRLKPYGFGPCSPDENVKATGDSVWWSNQLTCANTVWNGCFLEIVADPIEILPIPSMIDHEDASTIWLTGLEFLIKKKASMSGVEIFIVRGNLPKGGGETDPPGSGIAVIALTEGGKNSYLLAHELGHVVGGLHPGDPKCVNSGSWPLWCGKGGTILQASGSVDLDNPADRPSFYCKHIYNCEAVESGGTGCPQAYKK